MRCVRTPALAATIGLAAAAFAWQQATVRQLQHDGKTVSTNLREVDGTLMVSVKDIAAYLGGTLKVENGTATVSSPSNATRPSGTLLSSGFPTQSGAFLPEFTAKKRPEPREISLKVGSETESDGFILGIVDMIEPKGSYRTEFDSRRRTIGKRLPDDRIVVVRMRITNGTSETRRPPTPSAYNVTLFDEGGVGLPVIAFDARPIGNPNLVSDLAPSDNLEAPILAPKGIFEFSAIFSVAKARTPSRLTIALPAATEESGGANVTVDLLSR